MKTCKKCLEVKSIDLFSRNKRYADGLWPYCRKCDCERSAKYRAANPEKVKESLAKSRVKNSSKIADSKKSYRARNSEKVKAARRLAYEKNRDSELSKSSAYKKDNRHVIRSLVAKRSSSRVKATPSWFDRARVDELYLQAYELEILTGIKWHVDHIVPLQSKLVCGLHWHGNMQVITGSENQSKSNRHWPDMPTESQNG